MTCVRENVAYTYIIYYLVGIFQYLSAAVFRINDARYSVSKQPITVDFPRQQKILDGIRCRNSM